ncbi:MAG TPA: DJ-1 family protein, partial [Bacteroidales bacterium]|nr:DJ-1 family protein [Bacteroidales bacterium]
MVYIFLAEGFEAIEVITPLDMLIRAGIEVSTIAIGYEYLVKSSQGIPVQADDLFENTDFSDAEMLILPGGMPGASNLGKHKGLEALLREAMEKKIPVAAICAAPAVLGKHGLLQGRRATCYPGFESHLSKAKLSRKPVVRDGNIITADGPAHALL